ncbi:7770_t:CDS:2 [Funneliformis caledonium]|uniref:7770_t:CDS:1 n=1 Tax=Funneliformis caledonium TaxID=1117310 RepID=A0A9N9BGW6_9GLOM|nr:7770_t:CDS:2 [Funneliformis caledonium]
MRIKKDCKNNLNDEEYWMGITKNNKPSLLGYLNYRKTKVEILEKERELSRYRQDFECIKHHYNDKSGYNANIIKHIKYIEDNFEVELDSPEVNTFWTPEAVKDQETASFSVNNDQSSPNNDQYDDGEDVDNNAVEPNDLESERHTPTNNLFDMNALNESIRDKVSFETKKTCDEVGNILDKLYDDPNIKIMTTSNDYENDLKELFIRVQRYLRQPSRNLSEMMHMYRNILPYFDAIFNDYEKFTLDCGEKSLKSSSERRNKNSDPQSQSRMGQKCDLIVTANRISWKPELLIGEVSGGVLPGCSRCKSWKDKIKLAWGLRDSLIRSENELEIDVDSLVVWGVQIVGYKLKVYTMIRFKGLFHLILLNECWLPVSIHEIYNIETILNVLETMHDKIKAMELNILNLIKKKNLQNQRKRESASNKQNLENDPPVIHTPTSKRSSWEQKIITKVYNIILNCDWLKFNHAINGRAKFIKFIE